MAWLSHKPFSSLIYFLQYSEGELQNTGNNDSFEEDSIMIPKVTIL